jgi:hypothetical protein
MKRSILVVLLAAAACGGSSSVPLDSFGSKAQSAYCSYAVRCEIYADQASCKADNPTTATTQGVISEINAGKVTYDEAAAGKCLDEYAGLDCDAFVEDPLQFVNLLIDCGKVFKGTIADGAACKIDQDCISGGCNTTAPCTGTCATTTVYIPEGGDCSSGGTCVYGDVCKTSGTTMTCQKPVPVADGQPCDQSTDLCVPGDICDTTCKKLGGLGADCTTVPCAFPNGCDPTSMKCITPPAIGSPCASSQCLPDAYCDSTNTCVERAGINQACASAQCQEGLTCDVTANTCQLDTSANTCP